MLRCINLSNFIFKPIFCCTRFLVLLLKSLISHLKLINSDLALLVNLVKFCYDCLMLLFSCFLFCFQVLKHDQMLLIVLLQKVLNRDQVLLIRFLELLLKFFIAFLSLLINLLLFSLEFLNGCKMSLSGNFFLRLKF